MKELTRIFKALSDESRLRIYNILLTSGELCVCDIEQTLGYTQTKVSRHLASLKRAGLVKDRKQGLWILYALTRPKDENHQHILQVVAEGLKANSVAQRDAKLLAQNIKRGCCTTFALLKPNQQIPAILEMN